MSFSDFIKTFFDEKLLSPTSKKLYIANLKRLHNLVEEPFDAKKPWSFLTDPEKVNSAIQKYKPTTQRSYIIAISSVLKNDEANKELYQKYYNRLMWMNDQLKVNTTKSEVQEKNWMTTEDTMTVYEEYKSKTKRFAKRTELSRDEHRNLLTFMILSLYVLQAPRRNTDYTLMKISTNDSSEFNYLNLKEEKFVFNHYKTQKTYKKTEVAITSGDLMTAIKLYMKFHPDKQMMRKKQHDFFFLVRHDSSPLKTSNAITKILNQAFKRNVGSSMLRNIFLTDKYSATIEDLEKDAKKMGTSVSTAMNNYIKKDDKDEK